MDELSDNGLAFVTVFFVAASVLGMLWGKDGGQQIRAIGDRVACGLFAIPLISISVQQAFPYVSRAWVLLAPLPLVIYVILLALSDREPARLPKFMVHFSRYLAGFTLLFYVCMATLYARG